MNANEKALRDLIEKMVADGLRRDGWVATKPDAGSIEQFARERANNIVCVVMNERELAAEEQRNVAGLDAIDVLAI